jgi:hypothetical protein
VGGTGKSRGRSSQVGSSSLLAHPQGATERELYNFHGQTASRPDNYGLTDVQLKWKDAIHPQGYVWFSPRSSRSSTTLMVALVKPWWSAILPDEMRVQVLTRCLRELSDP